MLERILTGGQTGADQGAWRAAKAVSLSTGGSMPRGFLTEDGPRPEFAADFGAVEHESPAPETRTIANVHKADGTLIFVGEQPGPGTKLTIEACREARVPHLVLAVERPSEEGSPSRAAAWLKDQGIRILNVAGDRESASPGIGVKVAAYLAEVFRLLRT
jgi:hypothetical protein